MSQLYDWSAGIFNDPSNETDGTTEESSRNNKHPQIGQSFESKDSNDCHPNDDKTPDITNPDLEEASMRHYENHLEKVHNFLKFIKNKGMGDKLNFYTLSRYLDKVYSASNSVTSSQ